MLMFRSGWLSPDLLCLIYATPTVPPLQNIITLEIFCLFDMHEATDLSLWLQCSKNKLFSYHLNKNKVSTHQKHLGSTKQSSIIEKKEQTIGFTHPWNWKRDSRGKRPMLNFLGCFQFIYHLFSWNIS